VPASSMPITPELEALIWISIGLSVVYGIVSRSFLKAVGAFIFQPVAIALLSAALILVQLNIVGMNIVGSLSEEGRLIGHYLTWLIPYGVVLRWCWLARKHVQPR
jgi:hypothetical protein